MKTIYISIDCTCIYAHICAKPVKDFQLVLYFPSFSAGCDDHVFPNKCHRHFVPQISFVLARMRHFYSRLTNMSQILQIDRLWELT